MYLSVSWYISQSTEQALFGQYNDLKTPSWTCNKLGMEEDKLYDFEVNDEDSNFSGHKTSNCFPYLQQDTCTFVV